MRWFLATALVGALLSSVIGSAAQFSVTARGPRSWSLPARIHTPALPATVDVKPDALELESEGDPVTAYVELPASWKVADIVVSSVRLSFGGKSVAALPQSAIGDYDGDGVPDLMLKFTRGQVVAMLRGQGAGTVILAVSGMVAGRSFQGTDTLQIINCLGGPKNSGSGNCDPKLKPTPPATPPSSKPPYTPTPTPTKGKEGKSDPGIW